MKNLPATISLILARHFYERKKNSLLLTVIAVVRMLAILPVTWITIPTRHLKRTTQTKCYSTGKGPNTQGIKIFVMFYKLSLYFSCKETILLYLRNK
jgi:hypothetical protein